MYSCINVDKSQFMYENITAEGRAKSSDHKQEITWIQALSLPFARVVFLILPALFYQPSFPSYPFFPLSSGFTEKCQERR